VFIAGYVIYVVLGESFEFDMRALFIKLVFDLDGKAGRRRGVLYVFSIYSAWCGQTLQYKNQQYGGQSPRDTFYFSSIRGHRIFFQELYQSFYYLMPMQNIVYIIGNSKKHYRYSSCEKAAQRTCGSYSA
jgi:hypothetical protein